MSPVAPTADFFKADQNSIEDGQSVNLSWKVNNASSVSIDPLGSVNAAGNKSDSPEKTTTYRLTANGSVALGTVTVTVRQKAVAVQPPPQQVAPPVVTAPVHSGPPDPDVLIVAVNAYKSVYVQASGKNAKDCQSLLNGSYQGALKYLSRWCADAKKFAAAEKCTEAPGGTEDSPTMALQRERWSRWSRRTAAEVLLRTPAREDLPLCQECRWDLACYAAGVARPTLIDIKQKTVTGAVETHISGARCGAPSLCFNFKIWATRRRLQLPSRWKPRPCFCTTTV